MSDEFGFVVRTADTKSVVQVDQTYRNLVLIEKITATLTKVGTAKNSYFTSRATLNYSDYPECILAIRHADSSNQSIPLSIRLHQGLWYIDAYIGADSTASIEVIVYIFSMALDQMQVSNNKYGLVVRDENGNITFDSDRKYLRILSTLTAQTDDIYSGAKDYSIATASYSTNKTVAYAATSSCYADYFEVNSFDGGWDSLRCVRDSFVTYASGTTNVTVKETLNVSNLSHNVSGEPAQYGTYIQVLFAFLIDVTNY